MSKDDRSMQNANLTSYGTPPVEELIGIAYFEPVEEWTGIEAGVFYSDLYELFPVNVLLEDRPEPFEKLLFPFKVNPFTNGFRSADELTYVSIGLDQVRVNRIGPYQGFTAFLETFNTVIDKFVERFKYQTVLGTQIKYINRIILPDSAAEVNRFLMFYPTAPNLFENGFLMYRMAGHLIPVGFEAAIRLEAYDDPPDENRSTTIHFLISALTLWDLPRPTSEVIPWTIAVQPRLVESFEASITDEARRQFK